MNRYGQTWWGEQWLKALHNIDFSNRLPRGRTYANKGYVTDIKINKNNIHADVQGSRIKPYAVSCSVPQLSATDKRKIMDKIHSNPMLLTSLVNLELPSSLHEYTTKEGIQIFPRTWNDIDMHCSCPDWAVPCKHIAAVIYIIANEIDKNPFILFNLKGLDIIGELEKSGMLPDKNISTIPQADELIKDKPEASKQNIADKQPENIDFSVIPEMKNELLSLLEEHSMFSTGNFKNEIKKAYNKTEKGLKKLIETQEEVEGLDFYNEYEVYREANIKIDYSLSYDHAELISDEATIHFHGDIGIGGFIDYLQEIPNKYSNRLCPELRAIYAVYHFSISLIRQSAFIPQLIRLPHDNYRIRYIPALINPSVRDIFSNLLDTTPGDIIRIYEHPLEPKYLGKEDQLIQLISLFLDWFVYEYYGAGLPEDDSQAGKIRQLFFASEVYTFNDIGEKGTPEAIHKWLNNFYLSGKEYIPVIKVDEPEDNVFTLSLLVDNTKKSGAKLIDLESFLKDDEYKDHRFSVLESLNNLANHFSALHQVIADYGRKPLYYEAAEFTDVLLEILPKIKRLGIKILLPNSLKKLARPQVSLALKTNSSAEKSKSFLNINNMLDFDWKIAIGDKQISAKEFKKIATKYESIVKIKGQYVLIDKNEVQNILKNLENPPELSSQEVLKSALTEEYEGAKISISPGLKKIIQQLSETQDYPVPENLNGSLRPYQESGYQWLYKNSKTGFGSIIADDMGLGKTIQVIATILKLKSENLLENKKGLIVVPTTLITNWQNEIRKFAPELKAGIYHGPNRSLKNHEDDELIITSYGIVRSDINDLAKKKWAMTVIDEAQNIKNPHTNQTKAIKRLKSPVKIAMSGTPVENRLREYWSIFDFVNKKYLGSAKQFQKEYAQPIEIYRNKDKLDKFKKICSPFIIRREKTDKKIISDLPDKIQNDNYVNLTEEQAALYKQVVDDMLAELNKIDEEDQIKRKGMVFKLMTALKQVCNHPGQFLKKQDYNPELSGKSMMLINLLEKIYENNEKVLIFTQYKEMGVIIEKMLQNAFNIETMFLHGGTSRKKRDEMVTDFQTKPHLKTLILSIKAGGTGLNLTAASNVIHYDLWWNPAVENQATDRAFRIGQKKNVMVYRLITKNSFEEKINDMINHKKELADISVDKGEKWIGDLSQNELKELVSM
jgi:SNF2 family DNA or RNA helicase/uncharacterized Zn finger protein